MNGELLYVYHPVRLRLIWGFVYIVIVAVAAIWLYEIGLNVQIHSVPVGEVQLNIPYSKYLVGENVTFTIKNAFNSSIYVVNNCPSEPLAVYRQENSVWVQIHDRASADTCRSEQRQVSVPANSDISGSFSAWHHLFNVAGKYRVVAFVEYYNALPYKDFEVIDKPVIPNTTSTHVNTSVQPPPKTPSSLPRQSRVINTSGGTVDIQYDSTNIYIISITAAPGYVYTGGGSGPRETVTFTGQGDNNQFTVRMAITNGQYSQTIFQGDD